jgi:hypothetical protein
MLAGVCKSIFYFTVSCLRTQRLSCENFVVNGKESRTLALKGECKTVDVCKQNIEEITWTQVKGCDRKLKKII